MTLEEKRAKHREYSKRWYAKNRDQLRQKYQAAPEKKRAQAKRWAEENPDKVRARGLRRKYGLSVQDWELLFESQGRRCACCRTAGSGKQNWHVDHNHKTGAVRGILCSHCNSMIGFAKDDPAVLVAGAHYLGTAP